MLEQTQNPPLAIDARMLNREGTGVATYARALHHALDLLAGPLYWRLAVHRAPITGRELDALAAATVAALGTARSGVAP